MNGKAHHFVFALLATLLGACVPPAGNYSPFHANEPSSSVASPGTQGWSTEPSRGEQGGLRSESVRALGDMLRGKASLSAASMGCAENQVEIVESSGSHWTARCIDETYRCEQASDGKVSCTRDAAEKALDEKRNTDRIVDAINAGRESTKPNPLKEAPDGALGFEFGVTPAEAQAVCTEAQHHWSGSGRAFACDGSPVSLGMRSRIRLNFCEGKLCRIIAFATPSASNDSAYRQGYERFAAALTRKYGTATKSEQKMPGWCRHELVKCLRNKEASWEERWTWPNEQMVMLTLQKGQDKPAIVIVYHRDPSAPALAEAL